MTAKKLVTDAEIVAENPVSVYPLAVKGVTLPVKLALRSPKNAKKLLGRLIASFVRGNVSNEEMRTLAYSLQTFVQICEKVDLDERLAKLERTVKGKTDVINSATNRNA